MNSGVCWGVNQAEERGSEEQRGREEKPTPWPCCTLAREYRGGVAWPTP